MPYERRKGFGGERMTTKGNRSAYAYPEECSRQSKDVLSISDWKAEALEMVAQVVYADV